jgi:hypothetical protein
MQKAHCVLGNFMEKNEDIRKEFNEIINHNMIVEQFERA